MLESGRSVEVKDATEQLSVFLSNCLLESGCASIEEVDDTLARLDGQSMCCQCNVLCLLQCLGLQKCEARLPDGCDIGEVGEASGLHGDVEHDGVLCKLVEVGNRLHQYRGGGGDTGELASADRLED